MAKMASGSKSPSLTLTWLYHSSHNAFISIVTFSSLQSTPVTAMVALSSGRSTWWFCGCGRWRRSSRWAHSSWSSRPAAERSNPPPTSVWWRFRGLGPCWPRLKMREPCLSVCARTLTVNSGFDVACADLWLSLEGSKSTVSLVSRQTKLQRDHKHVNENESENIIVQDTVSLECASKVKNDDIRTKESLLTGWTCR